MTKKIVRPMRRTRAEWRLTTGAGGAHLQATSDPGKEGRDTSAEMGSLMMEKWKKTRKELEEYKETGLWEMTDGRPPGLEEVESEPKTQEEEKFSQVEGEAGCARRRKEKSARGAEESAGSAGGARKRSECSGRAERDR